jgi:hypothetical protein
MKIANIVSTSKVEAPEEFNVVQSVNEIIDGLPTLIIGYDIVNNLYPDFDIINISLGENKYWTFKRTEKRDKYESDLKWFISKVYADLTNDLSYVFVDPIQYRRKTLIKIIKKIYSLKDPISFLNEQMLYVYGDTFIFGIDLKLLAFMGVDTDKIKTRIKAISSVFLSDAKILIEYKKNIEALENKVRYLPYLYSIRNVQNNTTSLIHIPRES